MVILKSQKSEAAEASQHALLVLVVTLFPKSYIFQRKIFF